MRYFVLIALLLISMPVLAQNTTLVDQASVGDKPVLISDIRMEGFVLQNKDQFVQLFKPYLKKRYLIKSDMDDILQKIQDIYEQEGYQQLVSITYQVEKRRLIFTALMTN